MSSLNWSIRATDPVTAIGELDLVITDYELQSRERMADTVKRGELLKGLATVAEVQKHLMSDSAILNSCVPMRAEAVDPLRAEAGLHMHMGVDEACMSGPKGKEKTKRQGKSDDAKGKGKGKAKGKGKKCK